MMQAVPNVAKSVSFCCTGVAVIRPAIGRRAVASAIADWCSCAEYRTLPRGYRLRPAGIRRSILTALPMSIDFSFLPAATSMVCFSYILHEPQSKDCGSVMTTKLFTVQNPSW